MAEVYIGTLQPFGFDFAPRGWAFCDGRQLPIAQYQALYQLITTTYGGDGGVYFQLPDTRGRNLLGQGQSTTGTTYDIGEAAGHEEVTLTPSNLPSHNHTMNVSSNSATLHTPASSFTDFLANANGSDPTSGDAVTVNIYAPSIGATTPLTGVMTSGSNLPTYVRQPYLVNNYCIALQGIYPTHN